MTPFLTAAYWAAANAMWRFLDALKDAMPDGET